MMIDEIIKVSKLKCLACEYEWFPRITRDGHVKNPRVCARCKSKTWNREL